MTYKEAYAQWVAGMSPEERAHLKRLGIDRPLDDGYKVSSNYSDNDAADDIAAAVHPDQDEPAPDEFERTLAVLRRLVGELLQQSNSKLAIECLALVTGLSYSGGTMTELAKRHHITRAAVSARCVGLMKALNLRPSRGMRSERVRDAYRRSRTKHLNNTNQ